MDAVLKIRVVACPEGWFAYNMVINYSEEGERKQELQVCYAPKAREAWKLAKIMTNWKRRPSVVVTRNHERED